MDFRTRDRRSRNTFWIDDRIVDQYGPVMSAYPFGAAALAVYIVLARRADREGDCWPRLELIASEACTSARTVQRAIRLLEVLGLIDVALCYEQGSNRQTSNLYTLLTPPDPLPEIDPDPGKWPPPHRRTLLVRAGRRSESVAAGRDRQDPLEGRGQDATRPVSAGPRAVSVPAETDTPRQLVVPPTPGCHSPHVSLTPQEGNTSKDTTLKEGLLAQKDGERRDGKLARDPTSPSGRLAVWPSFVIAEVGLSNRQVWAATLGELARQGAVGRADLEAWLRPAGLIGREGEMLIVGAPNAVSRDRIATRFLPAVREAVGVTIGGPVTVSVVVAETGRRESSL